MTNNRKIANSIFNELISNNLMPKDIKYFNGYYIFNMGEDSVIHFHIKGIHKWKFGIWIDTKSKESVISFFAQYEDLIDKFKPSASIFVCYINSKMLKNISVNKNNRNYIYSKIVTICKYIKSNPKIALTQDYNCSQYFTAPLSQEYIKALSSIYSEKVYKKKKYLKEDVFELYINKLSAKILELKYPNIIDLIDIVDKDSEYFKVRPRYDVKILFKRVHKDDLSQGLFMQEFFNNNKLVEKIVKMLQSNSNTSVSFYVDMISRDNEWS